MNTLKVLGNRLVVRRIERDAEGKETIVIPTAVSIRMREQSPSWEVEIVAIGNGPVFQSDNIRCLLTHVRKGWRAIVQRSAGVELEDGNRIISICDVLAVYPTCDYCGDTATHFGKCKGGPFEYVCGTCFSCHQAQTQVSFNPIEDFTDTSA